MEKIVRLALRRLLIAGVASLAGAAPALAQAQMPYLPREAHLVATLAGVWDITSGNGEKRCRISLNRSSLAGDFMLAGIPAPCRMALPNLGKRNGWALAQDGSIHLGPPGGEPLLIFVRQGEAGYQAGDGTRLEPAGRSPHGVQRSQSVALATAAAPKSAAQDPGRAALAGRYAVARSAAEVGCTLTLQTTQMRIQGGGDNVWAATLADACRDEGLKVFAPAGWRFEANRIFLVARKGHSIGFSRDADGRGWTKDPPAGRPLLLRRLTD